MIGAHAGSAVDRGPGTAGVVMVPSPISHLAREYSLVADAEKVSLPIVIFRPASFDDMVHRLT